jgi:hypothetical protein
VVSEVPVQAPLPERAVPIDPGAPTPGQRLLESDEQLTVHLSFYGEHLETVRQDQRDIDLFRGRATIAYDRIGGSEFGANVDLEYRATLGGPRRTEHRINAAYLTYGMTDFRRADGPDFGVALGRVAVREAGYAYADGLALRYRFMPELSAGAFGGLSGNPFHYNWRLGETEEITADWLTGGAFVGLRTKGLYVDTAVVLTYANRAPGGLDRLTAFVDAGYALSEEVDLALTGWVDVIGGSPIQSVELMANWSPDRTVNLRGAVGRFTTIVYDISTPISFRNDPEANVVSLGGAQSGTVVDEIGQPVITFDNIQQIAAYSYGTVRGGYRFSGFEPYAQVDAQLRDPNASLNNLKFATLRLLPSVGLLFRDPELFDASAQGTLVFDDQTERRAILQLGVSRSLADFTLAGDVRAFLGGDASYDGGLELSYALRQDWMPGRILLRVMGRYYREEIRIARPLDACLPDPDTCGAFAPNVVLPFVPLQESFLGFGGIDWRW